eukprot:COSAG01_NODE_2244_length_8081_cov_4.590829_9_plen_64_part_00
MRSASAPDEDGGSGDGDADSGSEWEVQEVVDERKVRGNNEFLVRWHGFTEEDDTWEPEVQTHH